MSATEDEETQKRGITHLYFMDEKLGKGSFDFGLFRIGIRLAASLPYKICSHHACFTNPQFRFVVNTAVNLLDKDGRARFKLHCGTQTEILYELMTFGIPPNSVPLNTINRKLKRKNQLDFLKMRQRQESMLMLGVPRIVIPTHRDVLFGRGKPFREHRGNVNLYQMIDDKLEQYESAETTKQKTEAILEIVDTVRASGGRFLKQDDLCWMNVDEKMAREKVSQSFRFRIASSANNKGGERKISSKSEVLSEGSKKRKKAPPDQDIY